MPKVYQAINKVQAELAKSGIAKDQRNTQQGYSFRGIDSVYNALAPLLAEHGLCILPKVLSRSVTERITAKGGVLFYVVVDMEFSFVCAEDGSSHIVSTYGEAMDSGDKATNKAMSAAYKYAAMQAFCIPTEGDNDADANTPEPVLPKKTEVNVSHLHIDNTDWNEILKEHCLKQGITPDAAKAWCAKYGVERLSQLNTAQIKEILGIK